MFGDVMSENTQIKCHCFVLLQSRARQEDPEQARLKQKAKEVRSPADPELAEIKPHPQTGGELYRRAEQSLKMVISSDLDELI